MNWRKVCHIAPGRSRVRRAVVGWLRRFATPNKFGRTSWTRNTRAPRFPQNGGQSDRRPEAFGDGLRAGNLCQEGLARHSQDHERPIRRRQRGEVAQQRQIDGRWSCRSRCPGRTRHTRPGSPPPPRSRQPFLEKRAHLADHVSIYDGAFCIVRGSPCMCMSTTPAPLSPPRRGPSLDRRAGRSRR